MKKMILMRGIAMVIAIMTVIGVLPIAISADFDTLDKSRLTSKQYWSTTSDGGKYTNYRLPSIVVTKQDTVIVYGEARDVRSNSDGGNQDECLMDLYLRRSTDGGESFSDPIYIARGSEYLAMGLGETLNNPCMTVGADGTLHLLFCSDVGKKGVFYTSSTDDGITWAQPRDITSQFSAINFQMIAFGPGHGVCLDNGRLVVSAWIYLGAFYVYSVYSDDNGQTWKFGQRVNNNKDETCIAKTSDGGVLFNSRQHTLPSETSPYRVLSSSLNGTGGFTTSTPHTDLIDPACCGGMTSVSLEGLPHAILFSNCASKTSRNTLTVKCSFDDGITWEKSILIDKNEGGYSDIAVDSKGKVYVIYEQAMGTRVMLATFSFYETFCAGKDDIKSSVTDFTAFDKMIGDQTNVEYKEGANGSLIATVTGTEEPSLTLAVSDVSKAINVTKLPVLAMRVKSTGEESTNDYGIFFRCGRNSTSVSKLYDTFTVPNDGKEHTVLIDLSARDAYRGNLLSLELQCFSPETSAAKGDSIEILQLGFYATKEDALAVYPPLDTVTEPSTGETEDQTKATDTDAPATSTEKGCSSAVGLVPTFALIFGAVMLCKKRRTRK